MDDNKYLEFVKKFITIDLSKFSNKIDFLLNIYKQQLSYASQINELIKND
jgi:hypothetical protein